MQTQTLFDIPLSRTKDPISSYEAADELIKSGELGAQEQEVLAALKLHPGLSSKRLAEVSNGNRYIFARRLPGLRYRGLAQNCPLACTRCCNYNDELCSVAQEHLVAQLGETRKALRWWPRGEAHNEPTD
jgi:hypothetical protein